ncbi:MAG TPA: hypothetical protein ENK66_09700 [Arcobacter sp.]|nr:hypothetical protein [Arcobacter sp.]
MKKRNSIQIFLAVVNALVLRELSMRFSSGRMGLFWTFFEPFLQVIVLILIKLLLFGDAEVGFDFVVFLTLNFIAFNLFKNIVMKSINAFQANKPLFVYKQVKPIDTIISRILVEIFITSIIIIMFLIIGFYFEFSIEMKNLPMVTFGFVYLILFAFGFALFFAILNSYVESIGKLMGFFMTALMFGSAVFYTIDMIPMEFQSIVLYNPLTHFMEIIHGYCFFALDDRYVDYQYILLWTMTLMLIGFWLYIKLEQRLISK